jgi:hypothetical protein
MASSWLSSKAPLVRVQALVAQVPVRAQPGLALRAPVRRALVRRRPVLAQPLLVALASPVRLLVLQRLPVWRPPLRAVATTRARKLSTAVYENRKRAVPTALFFVFR